MGLQSCGTEYLGWYHGEALLVWVQEDGWQNPVIWHWCWLSPSFLYTDWIEINKINYIVLSCRISKFIQEKSQNSVLVSLLLPFLHQSNIEQVSRNELSPIIKNAVSFLWSWFIQGAFKAYWLHAISRDQPEIKSPCVCKPLSSLLLCVDGYRATGCFAGIPVPQLTFAFFPGKGLQKCLYNLCFLCCGSQFTQFVVMF